MGFGWKARAALLGSVLLGASTLHAATMSKEDYNAVRERITAEYKEQAARCDSFAGNAKDVCREQAKGKERIARAELEFNRTGDPKEAAKLASTKAEAAYDVAREKCDDRAGNDKDVCIKVAKAKRAKALAEVKANETIAEARKGEANEKRDADYNVAREKCDSLAGENKSQCIATAKARYGKS